MAKKDKKDRLDKLREKLANTDVGGRQAGFWKPEDGHNIIRIMDGVGEMEYFFQEVGQHWLPNGATKKAVYCPAFTSAGELECPICDAVRELYQAGDKETAGQFRVGKGYWMNVIVRDREKDGPMIFPAGVSIFQQIIALINDPDYGDVFDDAEGIDLDIIRQGKMLDTEYNVIAKRHSSPLDKSQDQIDKWYDAAKDLSYVELSDDPEEDSDLKDGHAVWVLPYDRILRDYDIRTLIGEYEEPDDDEDEDYEELEVTPIAKGRAVGERRARRAR